MDLVTARSLSDLNTRFYQQARVSFSATRRSGWPGWGRVLEHAAPCDGARLSVLDLACGNLRFERFLREEGRPFCAWAYDNCDELAAEASLPEVRYRHLDVMEALYEGCDLAASLDAPACDLAVCFGFLHHVPLPEHRMAVLRALLAHTRVGGVLAVSLWQFARDERILSKAEPVAGGDAGDYLLGWQGTDLRRYCHSFEEDEVDQLVGALGDVADEVARFSADGKRGDLNRYVVLRHTGQVS